ncbi:MAG: DNA primase [Bacillota bacterium]
MGAFISREVIENIREQADIVEVVGEYLRLTKKGKDFVALCPFHQEKTPSFTVSREKQIFHCFGCGVGGNVFNFLMAVESLTFPEAVRQLAARTGVIIPAAWGVSEQKKAAIESRLWEINALARDFYRQYLHNRPEGAAAREYLARRGINKETALRFGLGYAPGGWDSLLNYLKGHNYPVEEILTAGLAVTGERGRSFDRFRHRLIFPIHNSRGKVVGFGGRALGEEEPKYLNSPETAVFNKRHILYGLDLARPAIREQGFAIIMEGYMDVLSAHQAGVSNAVASLGTSLTGEQGRLLLRYTTEAVIAYDTDPAGVAAALRGLDMLQELGFHLRVVSIPQGKDPDEYIRSHGRQAWDTLVENAQPFLEYKIDQARRTTGDKKKILQQVIANVARMTSPVEQEESIKLLAARLSLSWDAIKSELRRFQIMQRPRQPISDKIANKTHNILTDDKKDAKRIAEQEIIRLLLQKPGYLPVVKKELGEQFGEKFIDPVLKKIFHLLQDQNEQQGPAGWLDQLADGERKVVSRLLLEEPPLGDSPEVLRDLIKTIQANDRELKKDRLLQALAQAEKNHDHGQVRLLLKELAQLFSSPQGEAAPAGKGGKELS